MCIIVYNKKRGGEDYMNLAYKILNAHLKEGVLVPGTSICIGIDQTLTQDSTGTMAYLQCKSNECRSCCSRKKQSLILTITCFRLVLKTWMTMNLLNLLQEKHGITFSKPGNGVCHQLQLENFSHPGKTLIGSDSHTPTCGAMGMIAIGAGGLDVAVAWQQVSIMFSVHQYYRLN